MPIPAFVEWAFCVLGPPACGGRYVSGLAALLGPSALRASVWPDGHPFTSLGQKSCPDRAEKGPLAQINAASWGGEAALALGPKWLSAAERVAIRPDRVF